MFCCTNFCPNFSRKSLKGKMPCAAGFVVDSWSERLQHQAAHWISPQTVRGHSRHHSSSFLPACQSVLFAFLSIHPSSRSRLFSLLCLGWIMIRSLPWYALIDWAFWLTNESAPQGHVAASFGINVDSAEKTPDTTDLALNGFVWIWLQEAVCWGVIFLFASSCVANSFLHIVSKWHVAGK